MFESPNWLIEAVFICPIWATAATLLFPPLPTPEFEPSWLIVEAFATPDWATVTPLPVPFCVERFEFCAKKAPVANTIAKLNNFFMIIDFNLY